MVRRLALLCTLGLAALAAGCADGESCGLGRCRPGSTCVTLFAGDFDSKAERPGVGVDNNYWCLGPCPSGKSCPGECMENPIDDRVVACAGAKVKMELRCPKTLGATVDGSCSGQSVRSCSAGPAHNCPPGNTCPLGELGPGAVVGPVAVDVGEGSPLFLDLSNLANTKAANPPLSDKLPEGITARINVPETCD